MNLRFQEARSGTARALGSIWWRPNVLEGSYLGRAMSACLAVQWVACGFLLLSLVQAPPAGGGLRIYWSMLAVLTLSVMAVQVLLLKGRARWSYLLGLCLLDFAALSVALSLEGGFRHDYLHLFYCPVAACCGILFGSLRVNFAWCTVVAASYVVICLSMGEGLEIDGREGVVLLARLLVIYMVNFMLALSCQMERMRWRDASRREQALIDERVELSRSVHDTTAQLAFMVSLGLDAAVSAARDGNLVIVTRLQATAELARRLVWQLRHLINVGGIYVGEGLRSAVYFHVASFTNVTGVRSEFVCRGDEPDLPVDLKRGLFTVAHNALANAHRHAAAGCVLVELEYGEREIGLAVMDDGCGLPVGYETRGRGFDNMRLELSRLGGDLLVEPCGRLGGATVACSVPFLDRGGGLDGT